MNIPIIKSRHLHNIFPRLLNESLYNSLTPIFTGVTERVILSEAKNLCNYELKQ